ncbi:hypothetical protein DdX_17883 [Ditylenchus destructor]|uniref:Uncharacterized protein n=1 Tax=Ditylenchus destructor TaxID=166010 RepID=A0AAD4MML9_9BILA|nr:hypothetical protein DdX_17883 [Ditylenchus destructor]
MEFLPPTPAKRKRLALSDAAKKAICVYKRDHPSAKPEDVATEISRREPNSLINRQNQESESNGDSAKRARIDTQKKPEEDDAQESANVASGSKTVISS